MTRRTRIAIFTAAIAGLLAVPVVAAAQVTWANVRVRADVEAIDHQNRTMTLRGVRGNATQHVVPEGAEHFNAISVGDRISVTFLELLGLHLRTPGAPAPDLTLLNSRGGTAETMHTVATAVSQIDPAVPAISIKSAAGEEATFRLPKNMSLSDFQVGDSIDVTYLIPEEVRVAN
jgi:hypothetical protein